MSGNSFINPLRGDRLDDEFATDEELATAIATRVATATYNSGVNALNTTINNKPLKAEEIQISEKVII